MDWTIFFMAVVGGALPGFIYAMVMLGRHLYIRHEDRKRRYPDLFERTGE
jgi:hypothetical protein